MSEPMTVVELKALARHIQWIRLFSLESAGLAMLGEGCLVRRGETVITSKGGRTYSLLAGEFYPHWFVVPSTQPNPPRPVGIVYATKAGFGAYLINQFVATGREFVDLDEAAHYVADLADQTAEGQPK